MKQWPPSTPASDAFIGAFETLKGNIRTEMRKKDLSRLDKSLLQHMRSLNVGVRLSKEAEGAYADQFIVIFDTVTSRIIRSKLLKVFRSSPEEDDVYIVPTAVTHSAVNGVSKKEARILADELVGGYYEQYAMASAVEGVHAETLEAIDPTPSEEKLRRIYEEIRGRTLTVLS